MKIRSALVPGSISIGKRIGDISPEANKRLKWFDYYYSHGQNARLTCRHFDISPQTFYRWFKRYNPNDLKTLGSIPLTTSGEPFPSSQTVSPANLFN